MSMNISLQQKSLSVVNTVYHLCYVNECVYGVR